MENPKFNEGYRAYFNGSKQSDNPYTNKVEYLAWENGWLQADADAFIEEIPYPDPESHFEEQ